MNVSPTRSSSTIWKKRRLNHLSSYPSFLVRADSNKKESALFYPVVVQNDAIEKGQTSKYDITRQAPRFNKCLLMLEVDGLATTGFIQYPPIHIEGC
jgi:hypothetical protein